MKVLIEAPLTTPSARKSLPPGLHWRGLDQEVHLGYRRGKRTGAWLVRWREEGRYKQASLGTADDIVKVGTLTFDAAIKTAREYVERARTEALAAGAGPVPTVRSAVEAYVASRDARESRRKGRAVRSDANQRLGRHILGKAIRGNAPPPAALADVALHRLHAVDLAAWLAGLPEAMSAAGRQRMASDLKAALNAACDQHRDTLPATVPDAIKRGLRIVVEEGEEQEIARGNQILTDAEITRLLASARAVDEEEEWGDDLYLFFVVLAATGMRASQIARMRVRDVQRDNRRLLVPVSFKGKGRKEGFVPVAVGGDVLDALLPATTGRDQMDFLLERWRYGQAPGSIEWLKDRRGPWLTPSSEISRSWQVIKHRAELPDVDPYCFRHSSIVRAIRANLPLRLIAARHNTSVAMIEKHYSRFIVDGMEDVLIKAVVPLVPRVGSNVVPFSSAHT